MDAIKAGLLTKTPKAEVEKGRKRGRCGIDRFKRGTKKIR